MPEIIYCPQCERKLRVPDELSGRSVQCPTCGYIFAAPALALPAIEEAQPAQSYVERAPPVLGEEEFPVEAYEETLPQRRPSRGHLHPHRGTLILVLGILSICLCGLLGPVAWIMGSSDLREMRAGRMDPEGEGATNGGRICGIIGTFLNLLVCCCGMPSGMYFTQRGARF